MFSQLPTPQTDPILSLSTLYRADNRQDKVDLGIGVYRNNQGQTPIMKAVKTAQMQLAEEQQTKVYVGLAGCEEFNQCMVNLVLGDSPVIDRVSAIQTPGGSGALRMLGDLMNVAQPGTTVWLSNPSYVNHKPVMEAAGLTVKYYRYFSPTTKQVDVDGMLSDLTTAGSKDVVLVHGCCHNPTGADIDFSAWQAITALAQKNGFTPFVDIAYQGFGDGLIEDARGVRYMAENVEEMLISASCSKNFGLYRERTGAAMVLAKNNTEANNAKGKLLQLARSTYTMPPDHGAAIVRTILNNAQLTDIWKLELVEMQQRMQRIRTSLCTELRATLKSDHFDFIQHHKGMFTLIGFSAAQMVKLREEYSIYGVEDGRINIAGLAEQQIPYVANAIASVTG